MNKFIVRFGGMRAQGVVDCPDNIPVRFCHGIQIVVLTQRGKEVATILCAGTEDKLKMLSAAPEKLSFVRELTPEDEARILTVKKLEREDFDRCQHIIKRMNVAMTLVKVERLFGNERIVVYYVADGRVDFRELVRALASEFQTRIEMKQIGVRDETKLGEYVGDCGRELCCGTFLTSMPPVSMRMAKLQKATLDPTKVSGRCGRLKCCLRYEYDTYCELQKQSPALESTVMTPEGIGVVVAQDLLGRKVSVSLDAGAFGIFDVQDVKEAPACMSKRRPCHGQNAKKSGRHNKPGKNAPSDIDDDENANDKD